MKTQLRLQNSPHTRPREETSQDKPAFPLGAACDGLAISTGIGALCGIIPAFAAVRVKPIDAIRY